MYGYRPQGQLEKKHTDLNYVECTSKKYNKNINKWN